MNYTPIAFDIETTGLNPLAESWHKYESHDAQVIAIAVGQFDDWYDPDNYDTELTIFTNGSEYELLADVRAYLKGYIDGENCKGNEVFLCGYNSRKFDHPYLGARYSRLRQDPWPFTHGVKRLDVFRVVKNITGRYVGQSDYAEEIGIEVEDRFDGSDMPEAFENRNWEAIEEHAGGDVQELMQIMMNHRVECMEQFVNHYGLDEDPEQAFVEEVDLE